MVLFVTSACCVIARVSASFIVITSSVVRVSHTLCVQSAFGGYLEYFYFVMNNVYRDLPSFLPSFRPSLPPSFLLTFLKIYFRIPGLIADIITGNVFAV